MTNFKFIEALICPICKKKKVTAAVWSKHRIINYRFGCCTKEEKLLKFRATDIITKKFLQEQLDSLI